jgi:hypothetical protein
MREAFRLLRPDLLPPLEILLLPRYFDERTRMQDLHADLVDVVRRSYAKLGSGHGAR